MFGALKTTWRGRSAGGDELRMRRMRGLDHNRNLSSQMGPERLWITTQYHNMYWKKGWLCWEMIKFAFVTHCCCTRSN